MKRLIVIVACRIGCKVCVKMAVHLLGGVKTLIGVTIQNNESIDRALKRFKKKYERSGILREFKKRTAFMKPSVENRLSRLKAQRRQHRATMEQE